MKLLGWQATKELHDTVLDGYARGSLLVRLRVIANELAQIEREQLDALKGR